MERTNIALALLITGISLFIVFEILVFDFHYSILSEIATIMFFLAIGITFLYMYLKGSRAFKLVRIHPMVTLFLFIGILITSSSTGLISFLSNPAKWTIPAFFMVVINTVQMSQLTQNSGTLGGFAVIGFFFGIIFTAFVITFIYDSLEALLHGALAHSMFPVRTEVMHSSVVLILLLISILVYSSIIWAGTAISGHFQLDPFFGTVYFIHALVIGKVSLSYLSPANFI